MTIENLTPDEQTQHAALYMQRSKSDLAHLAGLMAIDTKRLNKAQLVSEIVSRAGHLETAPKPQLDMTGLKIRCSPDAVIDR